MNFAMGLWKGVQVAMVALPGVQSGKTLTNAGTNVISIAQISKTSVRHPTGMAEGRVFQI